MTALWTAIAVIATAVTLITASVPLAITVALLGGAVVVGTCAMAWNWSQSHPKRRGVK